MLNWNRIVEKVKKSYPHYGYTRKKALIEQPWVSEGDYFADTGDASDDPHGNDTRPALDSILTWSWLEICVPQSHIPQTNLETARYSLVNPLRIVPQVYVFTAGMDPGYLLYVQHYAVKVL